MKLSNKYRIHEDGINLVLYVTHCVDEKVDGVLTGNKVSREKVLGYYPPNPRGRAIAYAKMQSTEISEMESQSLDKIIKLTEDMMSQVEDFFKGERV